MARELITFKTKDVRANIGSIPSKIMIPATVRALNKVAGNVRTASSRAVRARRGLPASAVNKSMVIVRANRSKLRSSLVVRGRPIGLKDYKARQTRKGVTVEVTRGQRKLVGSAFIVQTLSGHVFTREGRARLPITKMVGPSIPGTFLQEEVRQAWLTVAKDAMVKRSAEELRYELSKLRKKGV